MSGRVGHGVPVQGYATLTHISTGANITTLLVADGWNDSAAYLNFNFSYTDTYGIFFD